MDHEQIPLYPHPLFWPRIPYLWDGSWNSRLVCPSTHWFSLTKLSYTPNQRISSLVLPSLLSYRRRRQLSTYLHRRNRHAIPHLRPLRLFQNHLIRKCHAVCGRSSGHLYHAQPRHCFPDIRYVQHIIYHSSLNCSPFLILIAYATPHVEDLLTGCWNAERPLFTFPTWIIALAYELYLFALVAWKAYGKFAWCGSFVGIFRLMLRDAVIWFVFIAALIGWNAFSWFGGSVSLTNNYMPNRIIYHSVL